MSLATLPPELLAEISNKCPTTELLSLGRTTRAIRAHCDATLYRSIQLERRSQISKFCEGLQMRPALGSLVHSIYFPNNLKPVEADDDPDFWSDLKTAVAWLENLQSLTISAAPELFEPFADAHLPLLRELAVVGCEGLLDFVREHPQLVRLQILPRQPRDINEIVSVLQLGHELGLSPPATPIPLPHLRELSCVADTTLALGPGPLLSRLTLLWAVSQQAEDQVLKYLAPLAEGSPSIAVLEHLTTGWAPAMLGATLDIVPEVQELKIQNKLFDSVNFAEGSDVHLSAALPMIRAIEKALPKFTRLSSLEITCGSYDEPLSQEMFAASLDADCVYIHRWAHLCPTLRRIALPSMTSTPWEAIENLLPHFATLWLPEGMKEHVHHRSPSKMPPRTITHFKWLFRTTVLRTESAEGTPVREKARKALASPQTCFALLVLGAEGLDMAREQLHIHGVIPDFELTGWTTEGNAQAAFVESHVHFLEVLSESEEEGSLGWESGYWDSDFEEESDDEEHSGAESNGSSDLSMD